MRKEIPTDRQAKADVPPPKRRRWLRQLLLLGGLIGGLGLILGVAAVVLTYHALTKDLPRLAELQQYQPSLVTKVYARTGEAIADFFVERRFLVPLEQIPLHLRQATVAVEDARFYSHRGLDWLGVLRALWVNMRAGEVREGASTITQQVARMLFLNRDRTLARKLRELIVARRIEQYFTKDQILEIYLNQIFYGHNVYGAEAAAQVYFGKSVRELTLAEAALIAGLPPAPNRYSPLKDVGLSIIRRKHVLRRMVEEGYITPEQAQMAQQELVQLHPSQKQMNNAPYFVEYVRQYLEEHYGATALYRGGFQVYTTLEPQLQQAAEQALRHGLLEVDKRHGYRGPSQQLSLTGNAATDAPMIEAVTMPADGDATVHVGDVLPGVVLDIGPSEVTVAVKATRGVLPHNNFSWVRAADLERDFLQRRLLLPAQIFRRGDVIRVRVTQGAAPGKAPLLALEQEPFMQGALLTMEVGSGHVLAMVGGVDFAKSQFNRAIQATRQPGSAFKAVIYAAAIEAGLTPASVLLDAPFIQEGKEGQEAWKPENYSGKFYGPTTLRTALAQSRNLVTVRLLAKIGVPAAIVYAKRLGITSPLAPYLSLALGSSEVTLVELTTAYGVFANGGMYVPPVFITKIANAQGEVLEEHFSEARRAISPEVAYIMTSMLESVIQSGTGRQVRVLGRPAAGKTGTTNDFRDTWFLGYTPELIAGVWVGLDDHSSLGYDETGGRVASPIWLEFMQKATSGQPITNFAIPPGVRFVRQNAEGRNQETASTQEGSPFEVFIEGTQRAAVATPPASEVRREIRRLDRQHQPTVQSTSEQLSKFPESYTGGN
jgi:penicillin-binding protein 1A